MYLASIDNDDYFRYLLDVANRNNASFYPIDPRGLAAFDSPIGPEAPPTIEVDRAMLNKRIETLRTLAENTDGLAGREHQRSRTRPAAHRRRPHVLLPARLLLDEHEARWSVPPHHGQGEPAGRRGQGAARLSRGHRRGGECLARGGGRARARSDENGDRRAGEAGPHPAGAAIHHARLAGPPVAVGAGQRGLGRRESCRGRGGIRAARQRNDRSQRGSAVAQSAATLKPGERAFLVKIPVEAGTTGAGHSSPDDAGGGRHAGQDVVKLDLDPAAAAVLFKSGLSTGNRLQPAAGFQFSRTDRLHLELPISTAPTRHGPLPGPQRAAPADPGAGRRKTDPDGQRWLTADATLSALGAGDYVLEITLNAEGHRAAGADGNTRDSIEPGVRGSGSRGVDRASIQVGRVGGDRRRQATHG